MPIVDDLGALATPTPTATPSPSATPTAAPTPQAQPKQGAIVDDLGAGGFDTPSVPKMEPPPARPQTKQPTKPADVSDAEWNRRIKKATKDLYAHNPALGEAISHETADQAGDNGVAIDPAYVIGDMAAAALAPETGGLSLAAIPGVASAGLKSAGAQEAANVAMRAFGGKFPNHPYLQAGVGLLAPLLFDAGVRRVRLGGKPTEAALEPKPVEAPTEPVPAEAAPVPTEAKPVEPQTKATQPNFSVSETGDLTNHTGNVFRIQRDRVGFKPDVYQHKLGADPENGGGLALTDIKKFDVGKSGVITVHHTGEYGTPSSRYWVVNGHQRVNAADRLGVKTPLRYQVVDEGNTHPGALYSNQRAEWARGYGALLNLGEGRGTALDAAKFMRDSDVKNPAELLEREGISLTEQKAQDAVALTQLSDNFFREVVNGTLKENRAAVIGRELGGNIPGQEKLYADLKKYEAEGRDFPEKKLEELIKLEKGAGKYEQTQTDLFGSRTEEKSYSPQMADILANAREQLGSEKRIFGSAEKNAARLEQGGSNIDKEQASAIQQGAATRSDMLDRFAYKSGTEANATLRKYAELMANSPKTARRGILKDAYKELYSSLEKDYQNSFGADKNLAGVTPEAGPGQGNLLAGRPTSEPVASDIEQSEPSAQELETAGQSSMFGGASKPASQAEAVNSARDAETTSAPAAKPKAPKSLLAQHNQERAIEELEEKSTPELVKLFKRAQGTGNKDLADAVAAEMRNRGVKLSAPKRDATTSETKPIEPQTKPEPSGTTLHGGIPLAQPAARMAGNWISSTVERIGNAPSSIKETATDISRRFRTTFAPETLGAHGQRMAGIIRHAAAKSAASDYRAMSLLHRTRNELEQIPDTLERFRQFYSPIQRGKLDELPEKWRGIAKIVRDLSDEQFHEIAMLTDGGASYRQDYLPNLYKNPPDKVREVFNAMENVGGKTLQTGKGFLKHKFYQDITDAIDPEKAGIRGALTPAYENPVDMFLADARLKNRYIMGQTIFQAGKEADEIKFFKTGEHPDGWSRIDDSIATVKHLEKDGHLGEVGHYMAPDDAALVLNRFLGKGLMNDPGVAGGLAKFNRIYVGAGNAFRVGLSAFHFSFVSGVQHAQQAAGGLWDIFKSALHGDPAAIEAGAKKFGRALTPLEEWRTAKMGSKIQRAMLEPGTQGEAFDRAVQYVLKGGGRFGRETVALTDGLDAALKDIEESTGLMNAMGKGIHAISKPLMDHFVPKMKLGGFFKIAEQQVARAMERNGGELTEVQLRHVLQDCWDHTDSVFGQMVRDNQFMSNSLKDALHIAMAFPGWNIGTLRVGGNFVKGAIKGIAGMPLSTKEHLALQFGTGLLVFHMMQNAMLNYLFTGEPPSSIHDFFHARDGGHDKYGNPTRVSTADYLRTVYSVSTHPLRWAENILNLPFQWLKEYATNENFYGNQIRNPSDSVLTQTGQIGKQLVSDILPFSIQNARETSQEQGVGWLRKALSYAGVTPLAREFRQTKAENMIDDIMGTRETDSSTPEESQHIKDTSELYKRLAGREDISDLVKSGKFSPGEIQQALKASARPAFQRQFSRLIPYRGSSAEITQGFKDAFNVYGAASDAEKHQAATVIVQKFQQAMSRHLIPPADVPAILKQVQQIVAQQQLAAQKRMAANGG